MARKPESWTSPHSWRERMVWASLLLVLSLWLLPALPTQPFRTSRSYVHMNDNPACSHVQPCQQTSHEKL